MSQRVFEFDTWRPGYFGATIHVKKASDDTDADIFYDAALTEAAGNPQVLQHYAQDGVSYGKFSRPIYLNVTYYLIVDSIERSGVVRISLETLDAEDASDAVVTESDGDQSRSLAMRAADWILVVDKGEYLPSTDPDASSSTNNDTIEAAIGIAAAMSGGYVLLPATSSEFTDFSVPTDVIVRGCGEGATAILSQLGAEVVTITGEKAGIEDITVDGVSNQASSVGVYSKAIDVTRMRRANVQSFNTGIQLQGGNRAEWENLSIYSCVNGVLWHGDDDASGGADGDACMHNSWRGGRVLGCTTVGVELKYVDMPCWHNSLTDVAFKDNSGIALRIIGARFTDINNCSFSGNTIDISIADGSDVAHADENTVVGFHMRGGVIDGNMTFTGKCQDVVFEGVHFKSGTYTLTNVLNNIVCIDCIEDSSVVIAGGDATKWTRCRKQLDDSPASTGVTTDAVATEGWSYNLAPGEKIHMEATVIANGRNTIDYAFYHIGQSAQRPGSALAYDGQTVNFTVGATLTGSSSGATARITADADGGATGTLTVRDIAGAFSDNETITDSSGGTAVANGVLTAQNAALLGSLTNIEAVVESDAAFACIFGVTADEARVLVTGKAAITLEWTVSVKVTSG